MRQNIKKLLVFGLFFVFGLLLIGCNGITTNLNSSTTSPNVTTTSTTTQNNTTNSTTTQNNTATTTMTTTTVDTTDINTTTTQENQPSVEKADEVVLSIDRLENTNFDVDFDSIFNDSQSQQSSLNVSFQTNLPRLTLLGDDTVISTDDYIQHPYWMQFYYNKALFQMPRKVDSFYAFDTLLNSNNDLTLNNLYSCASTETTMAKDLADWAVDNITVTDKWIDVGYRKYLLNYDSQNDIVNLYYTEDAPTLDTMIYRKISIYYNTDGEEVVEVWNTQEQGYLNRTVYGYYNSVASRDFNYYEKEANDDGSEYNMFRGVNYDKNTEHYVFYDRNIGVISGDYGWYSYMPSIDYLNQTITADPNQYGTIYTPDCASIVAKFYPTGNNTYVIYLYLPSMNGVDDILVDENNLLESNVDSVDTQQFLINQGITPLDDVYISTNNPDSITGFETANGRFLSTDGLWNNSVELRNVRLSIANEGELEYQNYFSYLGVASFQVQAVDMETALANLKNYLVNAGLSYKFGDLDGLFSEAKNYFSNLNFTIKQISNENDIFSFKNNQFKSYSDYFDNIANIYNYIDILDYMKGLQTQYDVISYDSLPSRDDLTSVSFYDLNDHYNGDVSLTDTGIDTSNLTFSFNQSPILQDDEQYSVFYALSIDNKQFVIGKEDPVTYEYQAINFNGNSDIDLTKINTLGDFIGTMFLAKITDNGYIRISNVIPIPFVDTSDQLVLNKIDAEAGGTFNYTYAVSAGNLYANIDFTDTEAPKIKFINSETVYTGDQTITEPLSFNIESTLQDLIGSIEYLSDNFDKNLLLIDYQNLTLSGVDFTDNDNELLPGSYTLSVIDEAGNETTIHFEVSIFCNVYFFDDHGDQIETQQVILGDDAVAPTVPEREGYTPSWTTDFTSVTDNLTVSLIYSVNQYTITYELDGVFYTSQIYNYDEEVTPQSSPVMEGYTFSGWVNEPKFMPANDVVVTGTMIPNE